MLLLLLLLPCSSSVLLLLWRQFAVRWCCCLLPATAASSRLQLQLPAATTPIDTALACRSSSLRPQVSCLHAQVRMHPAAHVSAVLSRSRTLCASCPRVRLLLCFLLLLLLLLLRFASISVAAAHSLCFLCAAASSLCLLPDGHLSSQMSADAPPPGFVYGPHQLHEDGNRCKHCNLGAAGGPFAGSCSSHLIQHLPPPPPPPAGQRALREARQVEASDER